MWYNWPFVLWALSPITVTYKYKNMYLITQRSLKYAYLRHLSHCAVPLALTASFVPAGVQAHRNLFAEPRRSRSGSDPLCSSQGMGVPTASFPVRDVLVEWWKQTTKKQNLQNLRGSEFTTSVEGCYNCSPLKSLDVILHLCLIKDRGISECATDVTAPQSACSQSKLEPTCSAIVAL